MFFKKKITVAGTLVALVVLGIAASAPADPTYKNLKVLPKNITHEQLDSVMHQFNRSLNVKCNFCHASQKDNPRKLDFASDEKGEKNVTRDMMRMTERINKKFFKYKKDGGNIPPVGCMTCHNGNPHPEAMAPKEERKGPPPPPPAAPAQNPAQ
jgi:hypothetical protein